MDITFDLPPALIIGLLVSTVLPLLVGLVTKITTHSGVRAVILAVLAAITGLLTELLASINAGEAYDLGTGIVVALIAFLTAVGMHFGLWKPVGAARKAQEVGSH
jgi:hypothetical protein